MADSKTDALDSINAEREKEIAHEILQLKHKITTLLVEKEKVSFDPERFIKILFSEHIRIINPAIKVAFVGNSLDDVQFLGYSLDKEYLFEYKNNNTFLVSYTRIWQPLEKHTKWGEEKIKSFIGEVAQKCLSLPYPIPDVNTLQSLESHRRYTTIKPDFSPQHGTSWDGHNLQVHLYTWSKSETKIYNL